MPKSPIIGRDPHGGAFESNQKFARKRKHMKSTSLHAGLLSRLFAAFVRKPVVKTGPTSPPNSTPIAYWRGVPFDPSQIIYARRAPGIAIASWRGLPFDPAVTEPPVPCQEGQVAYWRGLPINPARETI